MLKNVRYDKIKLLHEMSCLVWFIEKHGIEDAHKASDDEALHVMQNLRDDLQAYLEKLDSVCCCKSSSSSCSSCHS